MFYEFRYLPVAKAFSAARKAGADVAIRYEAQACQDDNEAMIADGRRDMQSLLQRRLLSS